MRSLFLKVLFIFTILFVGSLGIFQGQSTTTQSTTDTLFIRVANIKFQAGTPDSSSYTFSYQMQIWNFLNHTISVADFGSIVGHSDYTHNVPQIASPIQGYTSIQPAMNVYDTINFSSGITSYTITGTFTFLDVNTVLNGVYEFDLYASQSPVNFVFCNGYYLYGSKTNDGPMYDPIPQDWGNITNTLPNFQTHPLNIYILKSQITPTDTSNIYLSKTSTTVQDPMIQGSTSVTPNPISINIILYGFLAVLLGIVIIAIFIGKSQSTSKDIKNYNISNETNQINKTTTDKLMKMNHICPKCGQKIYPTDLFCQNCGIQMKF